MLDGLKGPRSRKAVALVSLIFVVEAAGTQTR